MVPIVIQGLVVRLVVDIGIADVLLYGNRLKDRGGKIRSEGEPEAVRMGRIAGTRVTLPEVQIAGPGEIIRAVLIDGPKERVMPGRDGFIGAGALHATRIEFDFGKMFLRWQ